MKEVCILLEEDIHNFVLQNNAVILEFLVHSEDCIKICARVCTKLQWINEGYEGSELFSDFIKKKVVSNIVLGLCREDGSLEEDPSMILGMFNDHFQNMSSLSTNRGYVCN